MKPEKSSAPRLHRPLAAKIVEALSQIFLPDRYDRTYAADKVLERLFKNNKQLGARDRKVVAEGTYDIVRWWRLLYSVAAECCALPAEFDAKSTRAEDLWPVLGCWLRLNNHFEFPAWSEFAGLEPARFQSALTRAKQNPAIEQAVPDWLFELGQRELGDRWIDALKALNETAPVVLRANRLKATRDEVSAKLSAEGVPNHPAPACEDGLILNERRNIFRNESFQLGMFEVQDGASQQAVPMLDVKPGLRIVDGCAGAGGKTLHCASLMKNKGKIIALDIHDRRLDELKKRCARGGVDIVETRVIEDAKTVKRLDKTADRVLLDVPCTGLGVLRRNPDTKWKMQPESHQALRETQKMILESYSQMTKVGGRLVYSTCSILPSENEDQVNAFLALKGDEWKLIEMKTFWPGENGYDGFFAAALERMK